MTEKRKIEKEILLGQFKLGTRKNSIVAFKKIIYEGNAVYYDLREFIKAEKYEGPTKRGLRMGKENWEKARELLTALDSE